MSTHLRWLLSFLFFLSAFGASQVAQPVVAQQTVTSAPLSGRVEDARGAVVSGANLIATNVETNQKQVATSDHTGRYKFPYLQVGSYDVLVEAQGFSTLTKQLKLTVG